MTEHKEHTLSVDQKASEEKASAPTKEIASQQPNEKDAPTTIEIKMDTNKENQDDGKSDTSSETFKKQDEKESSPTTAETRENEAAATTRGKDSEEASTISEKNTEGKVTTAATLATKDAENDNDRKGPLPYRVKLYELNIDTNWEDKGTGYCIYQLGKNGKPDQITVHSEDDNRVLLQSTILKKRLYQKQQETLIVWSEEDNLDLALSFQDPDGCDDIWRYMNKLQDENEPTPMEEEDTDEYDLVMVKTKEPRLFADDDNEDGDEDDMIVEDRSYTRSGSSSPTYGLDRGYSFHNRSTKPKKRIALPEPDLSNLKRILRTLSHTTTMLEKDNIATFLSDNNYSYIDELLKLFSTCEDLESITDLHLLYKVMMGILKLNDQSLIEYLIDDEQLEAFMGILEYNPSTPTMKAKHREFVQSNPLQQHKIVFDLIKKESTKRKIQQTFRLEYLQYVIQQQTSVSKPPPSSNATRSKDENDHKSAQRDDDEDDVQEVLNLISTLIFQNHNEFINYIQLNHTFMIELFQLYRKHQKQQQWSEELERIIQFIGQTCQLARQMQNSLRMGLYRVLSNYGLFDIMCTALRHEKYKSTYLAILANCVESDVNMVRSHLLTQAQDLETQSAINQNKLAKTKANSDVKDAADTVKEQQQNISPLTEIIVQEFISDTHHELKVQYFEVLRSLLDPNSSNSATSPLASNGYNDQKHAPEVDEFLQEFYNNEMTTLMTPLSQLDIKPISLKGPVEPLKLTQDDAQLYLFLCEFLSFAIKVHGFRSKYLVCSSDLLIRLMQLYRSKYAYLKLAVLRFFRTCVSLNDNFYNQNLVKHNTFEPSLRVFLDTDGKDCLLNSAFLELLEYIRKENIKPLITHLVSQFRPVLETITYNVTCKQLILKYEQITESTEASSTADDKDTTDKKTGKREGWNSSTVDHDEEEYFNTSDDEDEKDDQKDVSHGTKIPKLAFNATASSAALKKISLVDYDDDDDEDEDLSSKNETEATNRKKIVFVGEQDNISSTKKRKLEDSSSPPPPPPPIKSRKLADEDDEDDVFAKRLALTSTTKKSASAPTTTTNHNTPPSTLNHTSPNRSPSSSPTSSTAASPKNTPKIVIKTSSLKRMRSG